MLGSDGTRVYLRDDPDGAVPRRTADPFLARPFPDRAAVDAYLATHPGVDRPGVLVVPWPVDLDRAVRVEPSDDRGSQPVLHAPVVRPFRPEKSRPLFDAPDGRVAMTDRPESEDIVP